jgi:peroxiredoxin
MTARPRRRALYGALGVAALVVLLVAVLATRSVAPGTVTSSSLGGKMAPPVAGTDIMTGKPISLRSLRGRYVLVDFFASWCAACQSEAPQIEALLFGARRSHDLSIIGVDSTSDTNADARAFLARTGATYPAITDPGGKIATEYGVASPPQSFLVSPSGRIIGWIPGGIVAKTLAPYLSGARA